MVRRRGGEVLECRPRVLCTRPVSTRAAASVVFRLRCISRWSGGVGVGRFPLPPRPAASPSQGVPAVGIERCASFLFTNVHDKLNGREKKTERARLVALFVRSFVILFRNATWRRPPSTFWRSSNTAATVRPPARPRRLSFPSERRPVW